MKKNNNLPKEQTERYKRNISINKIGSDGQQKLLNAKVLVAGCGGLGSTVIANLSSVGIGHIGLIDADTVELSNLNRQYIHKLNALGKIKTDSAKKWIQEYNKNIEVETFNIRLNKNNFAEIVKKYDYIIDCFDNFHSKFLLNDIAVSLNKTLIHGGVSEFSGQVMTIIPKETACLRCVFPKAEQVIPDSIGNISPIVSIIASLESLELIKLILKLDNPLKNKILFYNALKNEFKTIDVRKNSSCKCNN